MSSAPLRGQGPRGFRIEPVESKSSPRAWLGRYPIPESRYHLECKEQGFFEKQMGLAIAADESVWTHHHRGIVTMRCPDRSGNPATIDHSFFALARSANRSWSSDHRELFRTDRMNLLLRGELIAGREQFRQHDDIGVNLFQPGDGSRSRLRMTSPNTGSNCKNPILT